MVSLGIFLDGKPHHTLLIDDLWLNTFRFLQLIHIRFFSIILYVGKLDRVSFFGSNTLDDGELNSIFRFSTFAVDGNFLGLELLYRTSN